MSVEQVQVEALRPRVGASTAFSDCCVLCEEQVLEALVPTAQGPRRTETDGGRPLRRKFCGTITKTGVNDELADPRDLLVNIRPTAAPYFDFVAGFVRTESTPLSTSDNLRFGVTIIPPGLPKFNCDASACPQRAAEISNKVIHAEVTPDDHFYGEDGRFLPIEGSALRCGANPPFSTGNQKCINCLDGWNCASELEPHDGRPGVETCVYGVYAYDHGGHSASSHTNLCCVRDTGHDHPEIHPFDAIWWRHPEKNGWIFGVFQDDSNRYGFPFCGDHNNNDWSQAPRDLTFRFPFRFPRRSSLQRVCLRHVRTRTLKDGTPNTVRPLNVTTGVFVTPQTELTTLIIGGRPMLQVMKEPGSERETHVRIEGSLVGEDVVGQIILRVTVGCDERAGLRCTRSPAPGQRALYDDLSLTNTLVRYTKDDLSAGYYYAELTFQCACSGGN